MVVNRWAARFALAALVLSAAPALSLSPVEAASPVGQAPAAAAKSWLSVKGPTGFSPDGDGRKDKARFKVKVKKRAKVTVRVVRAGKVVRGPIKLGKRKAGSTKSWAWNGKNSKGKRVSDNKYKVKVAARSLKTGKRVVVRHDVWVDTLLKLPAGARLRSSDDTVYPRTTVTRDRIKFWLKGDVAVPADARGTLVIRTPKGRKLAEISSGEWDNTEWYEGPAEGTWDGRRANGALLDGGKYSGDVKVRLRAEDFSGNVAQTPAITIHVSAKPLVPKTAQLSIAAQETDYTPTLRDCGPASGEGCGEYFPCGSVVPSTRPDMLLGLTYKAVACPDSPRRNFAVARHFLDLPADAVRGGAAVSVTMHGRPTNEGEFDTASLWMDGSATVVSDASTGESATTATSSTEDARLDWFGRPMWTVYAYDDASYDVSRFDVTYKYLVLGD